MQNITKQLIHITSFLSFLPKTVFSFMEIKDATTAKIKDKSSNFAPTSGMKFIPLDAKNTNINTPYFLYIPPEE